MTHNRRWLDSVLAASLDQSAALPWQRGTRSRPQGLKSDPIAAERLAR